MPNFKVGDKVLLQENGFRIPLDIEGVIIHYDGSPHRPYCVRFSEYNDKELWLHEKDLEPSSVTTTKTNLTLELYPTLNN